MISFAEQSRFIKTIWIILLACCVVALGFGRFSLAFVSLAVLALSVAPIILAKHLDITLPVRFLAAITVFIFASLFMGEVFDFYERVWWWDIALHGSSAVGFGIIGFLFVFMLFEGDRLAAPPSALGLIAFCLAMTVGALWEIFEYGMDQGFGLNMQKSGLDDTMSDLMIDAAGAFFAAFSGYLYLKGRGTGFLAHSMNQFIAMNRHIYRKSKDRFRK